MTFLTIGPFRCARASSSCASSTPSPARSVTATTSSNRSSRYPGLGVTEGTIYPLLSRLRVAGLIAARLEESTSGPARKYYSLTAEGRQAVETMNEYYDTLDRGVARLRRKGA